MWDGWNQAIRATPSRRASRLLCGGSAQGQATDAVSLYDPKQDTWTEGGKLSTAVAHASGVYDSKRESVFLFGGTVGMFMAAHPETMIQELRISKR